MNVEPDLQAAYGLLMASASSVATRTHASRTIEIFESAPQHDRLWRFLCLIDDSGRLEGMLALSDAPASTITGTLAKPDRKFYSVRVERFEGAAEELVDFACQLLDYDYKFPADAGVSGPYSFAAPGR